MFESKTTWHSIETAPKDGTIIIIWVPKKRRGQGKKHASQFHLVKWDKIPRIGYVWRHGQALFLPSEPTHWMRPECPKL